MSVFVVFSEKIMDFPYFSGSIITVFLKTMIHFSEFCAFFGVPKKKVTWLIQKTSLYGTAQELLWRVFWALNVISHNVLDLLDFDWLTAIRRQCREM